MSFLGIVGVILFLVVQVTVEEVLGVAVSGVFKSMEEEEALFLVVDPPSEDPEDNRSF